MAKLFRYAFLIVAVVFSIGAVERNLGSVRGLGGVRGEIPKDFVVAVSNSPGGFFEVFVHERSLPDIDFQKGLRNAVKMVEKGMIRMAMSPFDPCEPAFQGNNEDKDRDQIPVSGTFQIDCATGPEKINATVDLADQDDAVSLPSGGLTVKVKSASGQVFNQLKHKVTFKSDYSDFVLTANEEKSDASGFAEWALGIVESGASLNLGFEGKADFAGTIAKRKAGDSARGKGLIQYEGKDVTGFPNAQFVAKIDANVTFGTCAPRKRVVAHTGKATIEDAKGNKIEFTVENCVGSLTYNGEPVSIDGEETLATP